jgi:nucleotide-binding universal stress UspA family protein
MSASTTAFGKEQSVPLHLETTPIQIRKILAATDLSDRATTALRIAARVAKRCHSKLCVLYAVTPEFYLADTTMLSSELQKLDLERAKQELHEYTRRIPEVRTTLHEEISAFGPAFDAIAALERTAGIDLLVMGSHGRGPAGKIVLGSVTESVIRNTHCPVLVAGRHCEARFRQLKSIVLATDAPAASLRSAQYATSLTRQFGGALTVVHVLPDDDGEAPDRAVRTYLRELIPHDTDLNKRVHFEIRSGNAAEEILHVAEESKADLIVMGVHEEAMLADHTPWGTLSDVIRKARCPVLAVQPHAA